MFCDAETLGRFKSSQPVWEMSLHHYLTYSDYIRPFLGGSNMECMRAHESAAPQLNLDTQNSRSGSKYMPYFYNLTEILVSTQWFYRPINRADLYDTYSSLVYSSQDYQNPRWYCWCRIDVPTQNTWPQILKDLSMKKNPLNAKIASYVVYRQPLNDSVRKDRIGEPVGCIELCQWQPSSETAPSALRSTPSTWLISVLSTLPPASTNHRTWINEPDQQTKSMSQKIKEPNQ